MEADDIHLVLQLTTVLEAIDLIYSIDKIVITKQCVVNKVDC